jgi:hypothetical protein
MDIERAKTALINADAAGDVAAAKELANYIKQAQAGNAGGSARAVAYGVTGGQVPFGNVITSGIGAGYAKLRGDERSLRELYDQAQADTKATQEANPGATLAGNVLGAVSTLPAAFSKMPQAAGLISTPAAGLKNVTDFAGKVATYSPFKGSGIAAGTGNLATRMAGGTVVAAPAVGLYAAGEADAGKRLEGFKQGAGMGAALGAALPVAGIAGSAAIGGGKNIVKGLGARGEDLISESLDVIKDSSRVLYKQADEAGVLAKPQAAETLISKLSSIVKNKDIASQRLYASTIKSIQDLTDDFMTGNTGLMTLDRHRQILGNLAKDITNPNKAQEAEAAGRAIDVIDDFIEGLKPQDLLSGNTNAVKALQAARSEWSKSKRFEKIGQIIVNAANDANKLKRDLERFRTNPKNTLGWSDAEKEALKLASQQTTGEGVLKLFGKFGFDLGGGRSLGNTGLPILGSLASGIGAGSTGVGVLVPTVGTAARSAQKAIARGKAETLLQVIENGGKVSKEMIKSLPKTEEKKFIDAMMKMPPSKISQSFQEVR